MKLNKKTKFGWSWTNDGYDNLADPPEYIGTINILAKDAPWEDPCFKTSNYDSTASSFFIYVDKRWYRLIEEDFWLIKNYGVSRIKVNIVGVNLFIEDRNYIELEVYSPGYA